MALARRNPEGEASEGYLQGILIENLHFVRAATWKQATAATGTMPPLVYDTFREKISDEATHDELFLEALHRWGVHLARNRLPAPLPATSIFIALQRSIGLEGIIPYIASSTVLEASGDLVRKDGGPYAAWVDACGVDPAILEPINQHIEEDIELGHGSLLSASLAWYDWLPMDIARSAFRAARCTFGGTRIWQAEIYNAYQVDARAPILQEQF